MHLASDFLVSSTPTLEPDAKDCELHNSYDTQSCILSAIAILLGSLICFFGKRHWVTWETLKNKISRPSSLSLNEKLPILVFQLTVPFVYIPMSCSDAPVYLLSKYILPTISACKL